MLFFGKYGTGRKCWRNASLIDGRVDNITTTKISKWYFSIISMKIMKIKGVMAIDCVYIELWFYLMLRLTIKHKKTLKIHTWQDDEYGWKEWRTEDLRSGRNYALKKRLAVIRGSGEMVECKNTSVCDRNNILWVLAISLSQWFSSLSFSMYWC